MSGFATAQLRMLATRLAEASEAAADELNALDGRLGDGDLGITVSRGWREVANARDDLPEDVGRAFLEMSKTFQRVSSSSFGTLTATALTAAAKATKGRSEVPLSEVGELLAAARDAMMARGKGALGDKSVLDAIDALASAADAHADDPAALARAAKAAIDDALERFRERPARLGRARMFGQRSVGLDDPGMVAVQRWVEGLGRD